MSFRTSSYSNKGLGSSQLLQNHRKQPRGSSWSRLPWRGHDRAQKNVATYTPFSDLVYNQISKYNQRPKQSDSSKDVQGTTGIFTNGPCRKLETAPTVFPSQWHLFPTQHSQSRSHPVSGRDSSTERGKGMRRSGLPVARGEKKFG